MNSVKRQWLNRAAALILPMVLISQAGFTLQPACPTKKVFRWARFEAQFTSSGDYENPRTSGLRSISRLRMERSEVSKPFGTAPGTGRYASHRKKPENGLIGLAVARKRTMRD